MQQPKIKTLFYDSLPRVRSSWIGCCSNQSLLVLRRASDFNRIRFQRSLASSGENPPAFPSFNDAADASSASGEGDLANMFGFRRADFGRDSLVGTVQSYDRHLFLRYKAPEFWPPNVEATESHRLPHLLAAAVKARKGDMVKKTRLTICGAADNTNTSGDILVFPDRVRYRGLTEVDVENFVEFVLVNDAERFSGEVETLSGSYIFVCAHGSHDPRCGVCGAILIKKFLEEISLRGLENQVFVSPCSHIGGHKYAGNVIIFNQNKTGQVSGHWYGYVSPENVPTLLEQHIGKGEIVDHLWRGQMGRGTKVVMQHNIIQERYRRPKINKMLMNLRPMEPTPH